MTETDEVLYCIGCGARIETEDKDAPGYVQQSTLDKYLEDDSKVENIKKIENEIQYNTEMWMNHSSEIDKLETELQNLKR